MPGQEPGSFNPISLGDQQKVEADHRAMNPDAFAAAIEYATKAGTHCWAALLSHKVSDEALSKMDTEPPIFDTESLIFASFGCLVCEQPYEPRLLRRRCKGEPR